MITGESVINAFGKYPVRIADVFKFYRGMKMSNSVMTRVIRELNAHDATRKLLINSDGKLTAMGVGYLNILMGESAVIILRSLIRQPNLRGRFFNSGLKLKLR